MSDDNFIYIADNYINIFSHKNQKEILKYHYTENNLTYGDIFTYGNDFILVGDDKGYISIFKYESLYNELNLIWKKNICSKVSSVYAEFRTYLEFGIFCSDEFHFIRLDESLLRNKL